MSILTKLGKKLGLTGSDKNTKADDRDRDVFNLHKEPIPEPIAEAIPAASPKEDAAAAPVGTAADPIPVADEPVLEGDALLLAKLVKQGVSLKVPRHAMFFLYFPTEQTAKIAQEAIGHHPMSQACGFQVTVDLTPSEAGWLCLLQLDLIINELSLKHVRLDLEALASQLGGVFEGWEASLQAA